MGEVKKKMLFYFYANDDFENLNSNKIHFNCISHYAHIFDEIEIVISIDNISDFNLIKRIKKYFVENILFLGDMAFLIRQNTPYCECKVFREELLLKEQNYNGLIFFCHNKGTTNYEQFKNALDIWLTGAYFFSLEFIEEVEKALIFYNNFFYGSYPMADVNNSGKILNKYNAFYTGTFFWINLLKHIKLCNSCEIDYLLPMDSRGYAEEYCGNFYNFETGLASHGLMYLYPHNLYDKKECEAATKFLCIDDETWEKYNEFKKEMTA